MVRPKAPEAVTIAAIIVAAVLLGLSQTIFYVLKTPPGFSYPFVHNYPEDYFYYLHVMRQGFDGLWTVTSRYTPEVFPGRFVVVLLLLLGKVARGLDLGLPLVYTLGRAVGTALLIAGAYLLSWKLYPGAAIKRVSAVLLVVFGASFSIVHGNIAVPWLVHQWTEMDPLFRLSYIPHHLWSKVFLLPVLLLLSSATWTRRRLMVLVLGVLASGFSSPVLLAVFLPAVLLWGILEVVAARGQLAGEMRPRLLVLGIVLTVGAAVALYHRFVQQGVFPWTSYIPWEDHMRYPIGIWNFTETFGPVLLFFLFGLRLLWQSSTGRLLIAWAATGWLTLFVLGRFIPLSNTRFLTGYYFIPVGLGAVTGIWMLARWAARGKKMLGRFLALLVVTVLVVNGAIGMAASWQEHEGYVAGNAGNPLVYVPNGYLEAFAYLDSQQQSGCVVLAPYVISTMIPAFTSCRVVAGHQLMTRNQPEKIVEMNRVLTAGDIGFAKDLFGRYGVRYLLLERDHGLTELVQALSLTKVFENDRILLYETGSL